MIGVGGCGGNKYFVHVKKFVSTSSRRIGRCEYGEGTRGTRERGEARGYGGRQYLFSSSMSEIVWTCHGEHPVRESDIRSRVIEDAKDEEDE